MKKMSLRRKRKIRNLITISILTLVVFGSTAFAWFIGMRTVSVTSFDVKIAATDALLLSFDGETWDTNVSITQANLDTVSYVGHTNSWGGTGLIPLSSVGEMDVSESRMMLYEKASLTATTGGYRLMASRVDNTGADEQDGYVVFDLFIHNFSGDQYIAALEELDEEAIYLTTNSAVAVALDGVANTGIENSVRVAFAQIGRVIGTTTDAATITGITCNDDGEGNPTIVGAVTGICRTAQIWEPNDTDHVANAISWYDTSCQARTGVSTYSGVGTCGAVANGTAYDTYAIKTEITSANAVDIYDGADYNTYAGSAAFLDPYDCFTDTEKDLTSTNRPTFMTLAPNSITKVRVYIYIEGQDVDNYDFASIGKKISVNFGFTKERYTEDDVNYVGPDLSPAYDTTNPVITLLGDAETTHTQGTAYTDAGATAADNIDGDITANIVVGGDTVDNTTAVGTYYITYDVEDSGGNHATQVIRTVTVE